LKLILSTACMLLSAAALADSIEAKPTADQLLSDVVAQLPTDPIHVSGKLLVRKRRGVPISKLAFELDAHWGGTPACASYTIRDAFGRSLEQLSLTHGDNTAYTYTTGDPLKPAELHSLSTPIQNTDLSWMDLTLAFLWWPNAEIVGEESIKTFDCYIVETPAPGAGTRGQESGPLTPTTQHLTPALSPYSYVRLWISKKSHVMLQAEGYGPDNKIACRLWVRSCKKVDGSWMIQDMEVQRYPVLHRTKLTVTEVTTPES
jgi:hypothetical protein